MRKACRNSHVGAPPENFPVVSSIYIKVPNSPTLPSLLRNNVLTSALSPLPQLDRAACPFCAPSLLPALHCSSLSLLTSPLPEVPLKVSSLPWGFASVAAVYHLSSFRPCDGYNLFLKGISVCPLSHQLQLMYSSKVLVCIYSFNPHNKYKVVLPILGTVI